MLNTWQPNTKKVNTAATPSNAVSGVLSAVLENTAASMSDLIILDGTLADTVAALVADHSPNARDVAGVAGSSADVRPVLSQMERMLVQAVGNVATFYNPQVNSALTGEGALRALMAYVENASLSSLSTASTTTGYAASQWLRSRAEGETALELQRQFEATLDVFVNDNAVSALAEAISIAAAASSDMEAATAIAVMDSLAAQLVPENTLIVGLEERLDAEAGDEVQATGTYFADVKDMAGAWLVLKTSGDVIQGWVMNVEGERPISEYEDFSFNSMTRIGSSYFGASDEGLYRFGGDTDSGAPIDAHVSTMMLDFGTTAQKRVVAAYLGYTSTGTVVLKVRSVDGGQLVEHWYEAQEVRADAPREGFKPLGRGLKSRYWQFELANVDGADFEVDKLELQPIQLSRRV